MEFIQCPMCGRDVNCCDCNRLDYSKIYDSRINIKMKILSKDAIVPKYQTVGSSGFDLHTIEDITLVPNQTKLIKTGLAMKIPSGYEIQIRPRSSLSLNTKLRISNAPGTIDSDYIGEIRVIVTNIDNDHSGTSKNDITLLKGDRIAQAVLCPISQATFKIVDELEETKRGSGGMGSTGK